jgi:ATP-dependent DNA helicase DinG
MDARGGLGIEPRGSTEMARRWPHPLPAAPPRTGTAPARRSPSHPDLQRQRVLVSTGTKNLQEQIYFKDLPVLRQALGVPFTATCMKGRGNYLCLHRFESFRESPALRSWDETRHVRILERWLKETETGDRAEVEDLPEDLPFWNEIAATTENCIGAGARAGDCLSSRCASA